VIPIVVVGLIFGLSWLVWTWPGVERSVPHVGRSVLPWMLFGTVIALLGLSILAATTDLLLYSINVRTQDEGADMLGYWILFLVAVVLLLTACGVGGRAVWRLQVGPRADVPEQWRLFRWAGMLSAAMAAWGIAAFQLADQAGADRFASELGTVGVVGLALLLLAAIGSSIVVLIDRLLPVPPLFRALHISHTPVLTLILVWALTATLLGVAEPLHDVQLEPSREPWRQSVAEPGRELKAREGERLEGAFELWRWQNCLVARTSQEAGSPEERPAVPLVLVATAGGGIRAAAWTTYVLDRVLGYAALPQEPCVNPLMRKVTEVPASSRLFAASGVSGGSVGLATYVARSQEPEAEQDSETCALNQEGRCVVPPTVTQKQTCLPELKMPQSAGWIRTRIGGCDMLAPSVAWMLYVELPWTFIRTGVARDRAEVLARSWEKAWGPDADRLMLFKLRKKEQKWINEWQAVQYGPRSPDSLRQNEADITGLYASLPDGKRRRAPLLLLNGTSVESGCRFNASVLAADGRPRHDSSARCLAPLAHPEDGALGATVDLVDFVCQKEDIRLSTAAVLSARFPVISPSGHLAQGCAEQRAAAKTYIVDGGYLENSGASTILGIWGTLAPLVERHNQDPLSRAFIVPVMIQIDSGYDDPAGPAAEPARPELVAPLMTFASTSSGNQAIARQSARLMFAAPYLLSYGLARDTPRDAPRDDTRQFERQSYSCRYAHFSLRSHPGPRARLGWVLSNVAFDDFVSEFRGNDVARRTVESWFNMPAPRADTELRPEVDPGRRPLACGAKPKKESEPQP
jgi:hypothetical protein